MASRNTVPISFFLSHPIQYFSPFLKEAARELNLSVYYFSDSSIRGGKDRGFGRHIKWDIPLLEGYAYTFLKNYSFSKSPDNRSLDLINPGILSVIFSRKGKIFIVNDWSYLTTLFLILLSPLAGKKVWLRVESNYSIESKSSPVKRALKNLFLRHFLFKYFIDKHLVIGKGNRRFLAHYGVPERKMIYTPYSVDNSFFSARFQSFQPGIHDLKSRFGIARDNVVIVFSGKLIHRKRPMDLLKAFQQLDHPGTSLLFIGDGELRKEMEDFIGAHQLSNVRILGFVNQAGISEVYAMGDIFVLCSEEDTWGLVVNEAMNFHMPVLVSNGVGCAEDLVIEDETGYVFEKGNVLQLANCLAKLVGDPQKRKAMGESAARKVADYNYHTGIKNITAALN